MCNKYSEHSKVQYKDMAELITKCNNLDFDFTGKIKNVQCLTCACSCADFEFNINGNCKNYQKRISLKELNSEIRKQNVNLRRLCKNKNLKYGKMVDMLNGKLNMHFKYYSVLVKRLSEKEEYSDDVKRFDSEVSHG